VQDWLRVNNIDVLEWPSRSPDLNPVENVWGLMVEKIRSWNMVPRNREELWRAIQQEWIELNEEHVRNAVESMNRRLINVIEINSATTKY
jgi:hypothetical protein